ncbi:MAG: hypothetical protein ACNA8H_08330 [Anaerolineales bacterium]
MRKNLFFAALISINLILLLPLNTAAQEHPTLSELDVNLWPEFDHPSMLVIYFATLSPQVSLPVEITLRMPASVDAPHAVAVGPTTASVGDVFYTQQVRGDWAYVTFTATMPAIQFEYYDPGLIKEGDQRYFEYRWPGDYAVDSFALRVQQPIDTTELLLSPATSNVLQGGDGLWYHIMDVGPLGTTDTFQITLDYSKTTDRLTYQSLQIQPSGEIPTGAASPVNNQYLVWALGVLGVLLIAAGGFWFWNSSRAEQPPHTRGRRRSTRPIADIDDETEAIYCHQCGKRAHSGDRFCRSCGARFRREQA